ncbi:MAG: hypothetical protein ACLVAV_08410 [Clostridium sp.]
METKNVIFELRTKKGLSQEELAQKGYGYTAGGVTLGKWGDRSQYGDLKVVIEGI